MTLDAITRPTIDTADHLTPDAMAHAQRHLTRKAIAELAHERLVHPQPLAAAPGFYELEAGASTYRFHAHRHALEHWVIDAWSITRELDGTIVDLDVLDLVASLHAELGLPESLVATYLEELSSTLASAAWKRVHRTETVQDLLHADLPTIEAAMTEGHPAFIASNGRIGLGLEDYRAFAPETGSDVHLVWLAVRRDVAHLSLGEGLSEESLYAQELDAQVRAGFDERLESLGLDPRDYLLAPVHPWQWDHKLAITFAPEVAQRHVVPLGPSPDAYRAQQSIRTFYNVDRPERHYVKTALSIQNMGFMRGLSPRYMRATPAINDWVHDLVQGDDVLQSYRFSILRERAAIGFTGGPYEQLTARTPYQKMFAALWRESPHDRVGPGERMATMASLLHHDTSGRSLAAAMITASGLEPSDWLRRYLDAYLAPLAYCLWEHDLAFMPHGENLILVIRDHVVERVLMKDVGEEVVVMGDRSLPADVERIRADVPTHLRRLSILTDVVDGFLRFLSADLVEEGVIQPDELWSAAAASLEALLADHPELAEAAARDDLFVPEFEHSCLNRLQLRNTLEMVNLADQAESLLFAGTLDNPLAGHR